MKLQICLFIFMLFIGIANTFPDMLGNASELKKITLVATNYPPYHDSIFPQECFQTEQIKRHF